MKSKFVFLMLFFVSYGFSQSVNDYKAVVIPMKYEFQKTENQYRLQTITKLNLQKAGFQAFYVNEPVPADLVDRCSLLYVEATKENSFLVTKVSVVFKDCHGTVIYQSPVGKSREKDFEKAYLEAVNDSFISIYNLHYKYNGNTNFSPKSGVAFKTLIDIAVPTSVSNAIVESKTSETNNINTLYAQPTSYGYQLINSEPKVIIKLYKTSNPACFMAHKGELQGVLVAIDKQWFFEYYQNDKLISEKIEVKF
jgi:hypothetical protein